MATAKGGFVNLHLFVSPEDSDHVAQLQRLLSRLHFTVRQDRFDCTSAELIRLGKKADPTIVDDLAALAYGANQYKVNFRELREVFAESGWAQTNILIAVAGGANDGTSGVREAADQTLRREIESFADVIFASSQAQREFWLGERDFSSEDIRTRYGGLKPCLHGSDAHKLDDVAMPFGDRFSWIKGGLEFDLSATGLHRSTRPGLYRRRTTVLGDAFAGHFRNRGNRLALDADTGNPTQCWPGRNHWS